MGAGASKSYSQSTTNVRMPIAFDFFKTFNKLKISENPWVRVGEIINYVRENYQVDPSDFNTFNIDIEKLHSEIEEKLKIAIEQDNKVDVMILHRVYMQLVFLFSSVINEIQNGPISNPHINLAKLLKDEDFVITYNWDTLMDRAMYRTTNWEPGSGYLVKPRMIYRDEWVQTNKSTINAPKIIKLHGSVNWLTSYMVVEDGKFTLTQELGPDTFYVYEYANQPYATYDGRFMNGYTPFSYGYYPVNLPDRGKSIENGRVLISMKQRGAYYAEKGSSNSSGLVSMPMIIPPVKYKSYNMFGTLFKELWNTSEEILSKADHIIIIGYSFPKTDIQSENLFKNAFLKRLNYPQITILNPKPERIIEKFMFDFGVPESNIRVFKEYFSKEFNIDKLLEY
ncbi:SIR2 family protein [uncultured Virgibacillus sp.]|nr:SIR2 family protein [uncultured Virgibacillus sp.]